jgi:arsenate reductase
MRNVLFLCTHNSARSILAEAILNAKGADRFRAFSAGSHPKPTPNPLALRLLAQKGHPVAHLRSKSWETFAGPGAPAMDIIITVCDDAAGETCPVWPGRPATAHWGITDPSAVEGDEATRMKAFERTYAQLEQRMDRLLALPMDLSGEALTQALGAIGDLSEGATRTANRRSNNKERSRRPQFKTSHK